jgi:hypothetical protein
VVAGRRETRDSKCRAERQDSPCPLDRSQENPLGVTLWKPLVIELDLRCPEEGDQESNYCSEQSCSTPEPFDLGGHLGIVMGSEIASNHIGRAAMNPASNGRTRDVQLGKEISISGLADCLLDSVVVGPSRVERPIWNVSADACGRVGRLGNALCFQGVAVATLRVQNVLRRSSGGRR